VNTPKLSEARLHILSSRNSFAAAIVKRGLPLTVETLLDYEWPDHLPEQVDAELRIRLEADVELYKELLKNQEAKTSLLPEGRLLRLAYIDTNAARIIDRGDRLTAENYSELAFPFVQIVDENRHEVLRRAIDSAEKLLREVELNIPDGYDEDGWEESKAFSRHRRKP
jgi:hypothetical protein